jgi:hypothetical protein
MGKVIRQFDSAVGISLDTGWTVRGSNPGKGERFFFYLICPHRLRGPPRLIFSGYRLSLSIVNRSLTFNSNKSPTWSDNFSVYYPEVCLHLNMFRAFSRPSSGAQWLQWHPLVLPSYRGDSRAVFVVGPAIRYIDLGTEFTLPIRFAVQTVREIRGKYCCNVVSADINSTE